MDLINEQNSLFPIHAEIVLCLLYNCFHIFFACYSGVDLGEFCTGSVGDYFCQGGLAGSGRAVEDDGGQFVSFDSPV